MEEKSLKKLEDLLKIIDEGVTKEQFEKSFTQVIELVIKIEKRTSDAVERLEQTYRTLIAHQKSNDEGRFNTLKGQVDKVFVEERLNEMKQSIDKKIASVKDGKTPTSEEITSLIKPLIPKPEKGDRGNDGKPFSKQDMENIIKPYMVDFDERLKQSSARTAAIARGGGRKVPIVRRINLTSQVDGSTTTFTVPKDTVKVLGVWGTSFPITFDEADFSLSGTTLTINTEAPASGQTLIALVETLFYA